MIVNANELQIRDVTISQQPMFKANGKVQDTKIVTYYIGSHGPFRKEYPAAEYDVQKVKADMASEVAGVRAVLESA
jgi:hypothetical protein